MRSGGRRRPPGTNVKLLLLTSQRNNPDARESGLPVILGRPLFACERDFSNATFFTLNSNSAKGQNYIRAGDYFCILTKCFALTQLRLGIQRKKYEDLKTGKFML